MSTINGFGTKFFGVTRLDKDGYFTATKWFSGFYMPLIPLWRAEVRVEEAQYNHFKYRIIKKTKLNWLEVIKTYLKSWILMPIGLLTPMILAIREVRQAIGIPDQFEMPMFIFAMLWLIVGIWKLSDWTDEQWMEDSL